jgi:hypothetical protein
VRTHCGLEEAKADPQLLEAGAPGLKPNAFEVQLVRDLAGKMSGARTFIESIEKAVPEFYQQVGQRLQAWVAPPPKIVEMVEPEPDVEPHQPVELQPIAPIPLADASDTEREQEREVGGIPHWLRRT